jgi:hypothetical protein
MSTPSDPAGRPPAFLTVAEHALLAADAIDQLSVAAATGCVPLQLIDMIGYHMHQVRDWVKRRQGPEAAAALEGEEREAVRLAREAAAGRVALDKAGRYALELTWHLRNRADDAEAEESGPAERQISGPGIWRLGASWVVQWEGEQGIFHSKDFAALDVVAKAVAAPNRPVELKDLVDADTHSLLERRESAAEVLDNPAVAEARARYDELTRERAEIQRGLQAGTAADAASERTLREIDEQLAGIAAALRKAMGPGNRRRRLGRTPADRAWDALTKSLSRLWPRLRQAHMPNLAGHLESAVHIDRPAVIYRPPADTPPWHVTE